MAVMGELLQFISSTNVLTTVLIFLVFYLFFPTFGSQRNGPPGPRPLPLIGNLLQLNLKLIYSSLHELSKKYGSVFTVHLGPEKFVVLSGYKTIKEALNNHAFSNMKDLPIVQDLKLTHGIVFANGESWKTMRNFALTNLKQFGMGKESTEEKIMAEIQHLTGVFEEKKGKGFDTSRPVTYAVCNVICSIIFGNRFEYDDPKYSAMVNQIRENGKLLASASIQLYNHFPRLFSWLKARKEVMKGSFTNRRWIARLIKGLQDTLDPKRSRCLVDSFLVRQMELEASGNMNSHFHEENLQATVINLFTGGTETTSSTVTFGLLLMAKYPEVQNQVQEELAQVVGCRLVREDDRKNLPYTQAVIYEIQRMIGVVPLLTRYTSQDVIFHGYFIKKGTPVLFLLASALQDEDEWEKPQTFNPAHFLDEEGNLRTREAFLPFAAGSRVCLGQSLAQMELFLFFASLLQRFRFTPPPGLTEDDLDLTTATGLILTPSPHKLCAIPRV